MTGVPSSSTEGTNDFAAKQNDFASRQNHFGRRGKGIGGQSGGSAYEEAGEYKSREYEESTEAMFASRKSSSCTRKPYNCCRWQNEPSLVKAILDKNRDTLFRTIFTVRNGMMKCLLGKANKLNRKMLTTRTLIAMESSPLLESKLCSTSSNLLNGP